MSKSTKPASSKPKAEPAPEPPEAPTTDATAMTPHEEFAQIRHRLAQIRDLTKAAAVCVREAGDADDYLEKIDAADSILEEAVPRFTNAISDLELWPRSSRTEAAPSNDAPVDGSRVQALENRIVATDAALDKLHTDSLHLSETVKGIQRLTQAMIDDGYQNVTPADLLDRFTPIGSMLLDLSARMEVLYIGIDEAHTASGGSDIRYRRKCGEDAPVAAEAAVDDEGSEDPDGADTDGVGDEPVSDDTMGDIARRVRDTMAAVHRLLVDSSCGTHMQRRDVADEFEQILALVRGILPDAEALRDYVIDGALPDGRRVSATSTAAPSKLTGIRAALQSLSQIDEDTLEEAYNEVDGGNGAEEFVRQWASQAMTSMYNDDAEVDVVASAAAAMNKLHANAKAAEAVHA